jgi:hypothetical protein
LSLDAACLAVSEIISGQNGEECEFWTADKGLFNSISSKKKYVKLPGG